MCIRSYDKIKKQKQKKKKKTTFRKMSKREQARSIASVVECIYKYLSEKVKKYLLICAPNEYSDQPAHRAV